MAANTTLFINNVLHFIPPDGTFYFVLGPDARLEGAVTVTAHSETGPGTVANFVEVIQMATRVEHLPDKRRSLDIVVRNNAHVGGPGGGIPHFTAYTGVVNR